MRPICLAILAGIVFVSLATACSRRNPPDSVIGQASGPDHASQISALPADRDDEVGETDGFDAIEQRRKARLDDNGEIRSSALLAAKAQAITARFSRSPIHRTGAPWRRPGILPSACGTWRRGRSGWSSIVARRPWTR